MPIQARRSYQDETQVIKLQVNVWLWNSIWETGIKWTDDTNTHLTLTNPSTVRVVGALQIIPQPVSSVLLCSPLPSGTWRTPGLSIPWCCLPTSYSVCLVSKATQSLKSFPIVLKKQFWWPVSGFVYRILSRLSRGIQSPLFVKKMADDMRVLSVRLSTTAAVQSRVCSCQDV